jgi:hypothetical protein
MVLVGPAGGTVAGEPVSVAPLRQAAVAVCRAARQAKVDPERARTGFYDNAHEPLRELARLVGEVDRAPPAACWRPRRRSRPTWTPGSRGPGWPPTSIA